jgi:hypothetical protein
MKFTVMEMRRRRASHHEWNVAALIDVEMFSPGCTV